MLCTILSLKWCVQRVTETELSPSSSRVATVSKFPLGWSLPTPANMNYQTMDYLEFIARVTSHIPDKGQVMIRYFGLYANAHRGKVRKSEQAAGNLIIIEEECTEIPRRGWAAMIRKVYEVDPLVCSKCGGTMKVIAFITDHPVVDRIINHLRLSFVADKPPPPRIAYQELLMADYFS